jgi:multidrug resistance protein
MASEKYGHPAEDETDQEKDKDEITTANVRSNESSFDAKERAHTAAGQDEEANLEAVISLRPVYSKFSKRQKRFIVFMASFAGFFSPLSANIYFPVLPTLAQALHVSDAKINLTLTSYMIFQGLAPTIFGDLADMAGRRPAYLIGFVIYIGANIGIALQNSYPALFVLRCLQSTGSSSTIALASGVVADIATTSERGTYMGWVTSGPMIGPTLAPVIGGLLAQFLGWRAIFWFLLILSVAFLIPFILFFPETARNVVGNGTIQPQGWNMSLLNLMAVRRSREKVEAAGLSRTLTRESQKAAQSALSQSRKLRWPNPLHTLHVITEKDIGLLLFFNSIVYTGFYMLTTSVPYIFKDIYHFNDLQVGLSYIPFGIGCLLG